MENRLNLLCEAGVIDKPVCNTMLRVVRRLETEWRLPVRTEQGAMAITHMASALMRSRRGEVIEPLDAELLAEMALSPSWPAILQAHKALLKECDVRFHASEEGYLLANLYGLWMAAQDNV